MSFTPDYSDKAREIVDLVRKAADDRAERLVIASLGEAFCAGALKGIDLLETSLKEPTP